MNLKKFCKGSSTRSGFGSILLWALIFVALGFLVTSSCAQQKFTADVSMSVSPAGVYYGDPVEIEWTISSYNFTCISYDLQIFHNGADVIGPVTYHVNDVSPGVHGPVEDSYTWTVPIGSDLGKYFAQIDFNTEEVGGLQHYVGTAFVVSNGTLEIFKFEDLNGNGVYDRGEPGLSDWTFKITGERLLIEKVTNKDGTIRVKLLPGKYEVSEVPKTGWMASTSDTQSVDVTNDKTKTVRFGNYRPSELNIQMFDDRDRNGRHDSGESYLSGYTFDIRVPNGTTISRTTGSGGIKLAGAPGTYVVEEGPLPGLWVPTTSTKVQRTLNSGDDATLEFGIAEGSGLKVIIFEDLNINGEFDTGDLILPSWEPTIEGFAEIPDFFWPGDYVVFVLPLSGWMPTTETRQSVNLIPGVPKILYFGFTSNVLEIMKFEDRNNNGKHDPSEPGLLGWEFSIKGPKGTETKVTDDEGKISYTYVPGDYVITEVQKDSEGWYNTTSNIRSVDLDRGHVSQKFGNDRFRILEIFKFHDINRNGEPDFEEPGVANWEFIVQDEKTSEKKRVYTDKEGIAKYNVKSARDYTVSETVKLPWRSTTPLVRDIWIDPSKSAVKVKFGNYLPPRLSITKFQDGNLNGVMDEGETGIEGWNFSIEDPKGNVYSKETDSRGSIIFRCPEEGLYKVEEVAKDGWINTTPSRIEVEILSGRNEAVAFGNVMPKCPCDEGFPTPGNTNGDENVRVIKSLNPDTLHADMIDTCNGTLINYTLTICAEEKMKPTDLVLAVDTSGSMVSAGTEPLERLSDDITSFVSNIRGTPELRVGLVSWDENIDEIVSPTENYDAVIVAAGNLSSNIKEFTCYQAGLDGAISAFKRSPSSSDKVVVFITDATGSYKPVIKYPDRPDYTVHMLVINPSEKAVDAGRRENLTKISEPTGGSLKIVDDPSKIGVELEELLLLQLTNQTLENVQVTDSLPSYLHPIGGNFTENDDGMDWKTTTMRWDVGELSSNECWNTSFAVLFCWRLPADVVQKEDAPRVTSEVTYIDPDTSSERTLSMPEGMIKIEPKRTEPVSTRRAESNIPGFEFLASILCLLVMAHFFRKRP